MSSAGQRLRQWWMDHVADLGLVIMFLYVVALAVATSREIAAY